MLNLLILIGLAILPLSYYKIHNMKKRLNVLSEQIESIATYHLLPLDTSNSNEEHVWEDVSIACIYESFLFQKVHAKTSQCKRCGLICRTIIDNYALAKIKNVDLYEGYYINGFKVQDFGCKQ